MSAIAARHVIVLKFMKRDLLGEKRSRRICQEKNPLAVPLVTTPFMHVSYRHNLRGARNLTVIIRSVMDSAERSVSFALSKISDFDPT
jgi:hypothetical protein